MVHGSCMSLVIHTFHGSGSVSASWTIRFTLRCSTSQFSLDISENTANVEKQYILMRRQLEYYKNPGRKNRTS